MNENIFLLHIVLVAAFVLMAFRMGKYALVVFITLSALLANLFVVKQIELFSLTVTASDVFAVASIWGLNLLQEYYGKDSAQKTINITFFFLVFFALMAKMHLLYLPSKADYTNSSFWVILSQTPRIVMASLVTFFIVQKIDVQLFAYLSKKISRKLPLRVAISLSISQLLDTILFTFFALYGVVKSPGHVIVLSYCIKLIVILVSVGINIFIRPKVPRYDIV